MNSAVLLVTGEMDLAVQLSQSEGDLEKRRGAAGLGLGDFFRRALGDDLATGVVGFWAEVEDPVGFGGDGHVVLDDDHGVAFIDEALDIFEVEADGGLFDQIEIALVEEGVVEGGLGASKPSAKSPSPLTETSRTPSTRTVS